MKCPKKDCKGRFYYGKCASCGPAYLNYDGINPKKLYIAVDFDGTLCNHEYPEIGKVFDRHQKVIDFVNKMHQKGHVIILWTCRTDTSTRKYLAEAVAWCKLNNIHIDYINSNPEDEVRFETNGRKVYADVYIDDKSLNMLDIDSPTSIYYSLFNQ